MKCPDCGLLAEFTKVLDSENHKHTVKRRRACGSCGYTWHTYEIPEAEFYNPRNKHEYLPWSTNEELTAVKLRQEGLTFGEIGKQLGRTRTAVGRKIDKLTADKTYFNLLQEIERRKNSDDQTIIY